MIGYNSLLQAGLSIDEAPDLFTAYEAQWHKAGLNPPWEGLLDDPNSCTFGSSDN